MTHSLARLQNAIYGFNKRIFTKDDFLRITRREGIRVYFWHLKKNINGFYGLNRRCKRPTKYIIINDRLLPDRWLFTGFHELIHHFLHAPQVNIDVYYSKLHASTREEKEADMFARMMMIPKPLLLELLSASQDELVAFDLTALELRMSDLSNFGE